jgi:tetratricopeptide (TPR) repeat protein
MDKAELLKYV